MRQKALDNVMIEKGGTGLPGTSSTFGLSTSRLPWTSGPSHTRQKNFADALLKRGGLLAPLPILQRSKTCLRWSNGGYLKPARRKPNLRSRSRARKNPDQRWPGLEVDDAGWVQTIRTATNASARWSLGSRPQTVFRRRRAKPRRPPQAAIRPGRPAPTTGPGTATPSTCKTAGRPLTSAYHRS
jgi:hypothetical protein